PNNFDTVQITRELFQGKDRVGEEKVEAKVIAYLEEEDLAVVAIRKKNFARKEDSVQFAASLPNSGREVVHLTAWANYKLNFFTFGIIDCPNYIYEDKSYISESACGMAGSSGGGVFDVNTLECVGILTRTSSRTKSLLEGIDRIRNFAKITGVEWLLSEE